MKILFKGWLDLLSKGMFGMSEDFFSVAFLEFTRIRILVILWFLHSDALKEYNFSLYKRLPGKGK